MAKWRDVKSDSGELLYSERRCGNYRVWPEYGRWAGYHCDKPIGLADTLTLAQLLCRDHLEELLQAERNPTERA